MTDEHVHPTLKFEWHPALSARLVWTIVSAGVVESLVFGLSVVPCAYFFELLLRVDYPNRFVAASVLGIMFIPTYVAFAVYLMILSAVSTRLTGWRTPPNMDMRIAALEWPVLGWARYMVSIHIVRLFAGSLLRATPLWTFYLRLNGARLGKGVLHQQPGGHGPQPAGVRLITSSSVTASISRAIRSNAEWSARRRCGSAVCVMVGLGSVVGIGVEAGPGCQIGALSLVPKFAKLEAGVTYAGTPVHKIEPPSSLEVERGR